MSERRARLFTKAKDETVSDELSRRSRWLALNTAPYDWSERVIHVDDETWVVISDLLVWVEVLVNCVGAPEREEAAVVHIEEIISKKRLSSYARLRAKALCALRARMILDDLADV